MQELKTRLSVNVRLAELKDLDFCIKSDFKHVDAYRGRVFMEKYLRRQIEAKDVILAEVDGNPVGYLRVRYLGLLIPSLGIIVVNEKYRRKGVGTAMIDFLKSICSNVKDIRSSHVTDMHFCIVLQKQLQ